MYFCLEKLPTTFRTGHNINIFAASMQLFGRRSHTLSLSDWVLLVFTLRTLFWQDFCMGGDMLFLLYCLRFSRLFLYWWHYIWLLGWNLSTKSPHCFGNFSLCNIYLKVLVTILIFTSFHPTILTIDEWSLSESIIALESQSGINTFAIPPFLLHLLAEILSKRNFLLHTHFLM